MTFLQAIVEILVDTPPPLEEEKIRVYDCLKKEIEELIKLLHKQKTMESESTVDSAKVKQELNSQSGDGMSSPLHSLIESTSVLQCQFKITGQIGDRDQKDTGKLNYSSLRKQHEMGVEQKYKKHEIVDGVIRAISPG